MAQNPPTHIAELTSRLHACRTALQHSVGEVEDRINVPRRIRDEIASNPLKWAAIGAGAGLAVLKLLPLALRLTRKTWAGALVSPLVQTAATMALPLVMESAQRFMQSRTAQPTPPYRTLPPDIS